jgi:hypothetical protein
LAKSPAGSGAQEDTRLWEQDFGQIGGAFRGRFDAAMMCAGKKRAGALFFHGQFQAPRE